MNLSPEQQAQLAEQKKQCVFCKLVAKEIPAKIVFEDEKTLALLDIYPAVKGHTLFLPKEHYPLLPYLPDDEFKHYFGIAPALAKAIKEGMVSTAFNIFIANGGAAGQQAPHFFTHFMPREEGDGFFNFLFHTKKRPLEQKEVISFAKNFSVTMQHHFNKNPASWHTGIGEVPAYLERLYQESALLYEDEKVLCIFPTDNLVQGHMEIYSKSEEKFIEKLSAEDAAHLFYVASIAASLVFEGFKAQGTNIILKSGRTEDNSRGRLCLHIIPRKQDDQLEGIIWKPKQPTYNLDGVVGKIKDKTWKVKYKEEKKEEKKKVFKPEIIKMSIGKKEEQKHSSKEEIQKAIEKMKR